MELDVTEQDKLLLENISLRDALVHALEVIAFERSSLANKHGSTSEEYTSFDSFAKPREELATEALRGELGTRYEAYVSLMNWCLQYYSDPVMYKRSFMDPWPPIVYDNGDQAKNALGIDAGRGLLMRVQDLMEAGDELREVVELLTSKSTHGEGVRRNHAARYRWVKLTQRMKGQDVTSIPGEAQAALDARGGQEAEDRAGAETVEEPVRGSSVRESPGGDEGLLDGGDVRGDDH